MGFALNRSQLRMLDEEDTPVESTTQPPECWFHIGKIDGRIQNRQNKIDALLVDSRYVQSIHLFRKPTNIYQRS